MRPPPTKAHEQRLLNGVSRVAAINRVPAQRSLRTPDRTGARWALQPACVGAAASGRLSRVDARARAYGMHAWPYGGARRPTSSGASAARECTPWPMVARFGSGNPRAMRLLPTLRRSRADDPVLAWAFRYALATMVAGAGILLHGPSPAVGWALIVFGGSLATLMSGPPTRREEGADPGTARSASRASRRGDRRIEHAHGHRRASAASRLSRGPRSIAR
jgi:hypothetical protein